MARTGNQPSPLAVESSNQNTSGRSQKIQASPLAADTSNQSSSGKSQITVKLTPVNQTKIIEPHPTQIFPKNKGEFFPSDHQIKSDFTKTSLESQPIKKTVTSTKTSHAPSPPTQSNSATLSSTPSHSTNNSPQTGNKKSGARIRAGCINARAKFWEKKIQGDSLSAEEEFPSMVEHVQD